MGCVQGDEAHLAFGRAGQSEAELQTFGIPVSMIPGICNEGPCSSKSPRRSSRILLDSRFYCWKVSPPGI